MICMLDLPICHLPGCAWWKAEKRCRSRPSPSICRRCGSCTASGRAREDGGAGHRLGRASEQTGDLRQHVISGGAAFRLGPVALVQLVLDERVTQHLQGIGTEPGERRADAAGEPVRLRYAQTPATAPTAPAATGWARASRAAPNSL